MIKKRGAASRGPSPLHNPRDLQVFHFDIEYGGVTRTDSEAISRRISLAHTHNLLSESKWDTVRLMEILENELSAYQNVDCTRISLSGSPIALNSKDAVAISMIVHELATNAAKHGSLSNIDGRVVVSWLESNGMIRWIGRRQMVRQFSIQGNEFWDQID